MTFTNKNIPEAEYENYDLRKVRINFLSIQIILEIYLFVRFEE